MVAHLHLFYDSNANLITFDMRLLITRNRSSEAISQAEEFAVKQRSMFCRKKAELVTNMGRLVSSTTIANQNMSKFEAQKNKEEAKFVTSSPYPE